MRTRGSWAAWAILGLWLAGGAGCRTDDSGPTAMERPARTPDEGMTGITIHNIKIGDTRWVLRADSASVFREKRQVEAENVEIEFFENEEHVSTLTADRGILQQVTDDLEARGNVRVLSKDGALLETAVLYWDHQKARIHTPEYVEITKDGDVLTGVGLEADPGLDRVDIKEHVRGAMQSEPDALFDDSKREGGS
jgi:LPS export ABC transporter protein LptC